LGTRTPVAYDSGFVSSYIPNQSSLLPPQLAADLYHAGRSQDQQPAGTYAREVLEQLLIDLSWSSSRLEGNNKSLLDTKALFELGQQGGPLDEDTLMLLNHKSAIEFMVDAVPTEGITVHSPTFQSMPLTAQRRIANTELDQLEPYNCARYNLARGMTQRWIDAGRRR
jgi:hypothetical protein